MLWRLNILISTKGFADCLAQGHSINISCYICICVQKDIANWKPTGQICFGWFHKWVCMSVHVCLTHDQHVKKKISRNSKLNYGFPAAGERVGKGKGWSVRELKIWQQKSVSAWRQSATVEQKLLFLACTLRWAQSSLFPFILDPTCFPQFHYLPGHYSHSSLHPMAISHSSLTWYIWRIHSHISEKSYLNKMWSTKNGFYYVYLWQK